MIFSTPKSGRVLVIALAGLLSFGSAKAQEIGSPPRLTMLPMERRVLPIGQRGQEMEVVVYTPHTYDPAESYPLLVVPDADPPLATPFVGSDFENATQTRWRRGFDRSTRVYVSYAEDDLALVRAGTPPWIEGWEMVDDANLTFRSEVIGGLRHDAGAIPALINAYGFLYGR